ncbi:MAG: hypothetical protein AAGH68_09695 [Pseudomonadota bacterium]
MSDTDERKSMDDVLASIRRIVRSEKDPEPAVAVPEAEERPVMGPAEGGEDVPLELTAEMRTDEAPETTAASPVMDTAVGAMAGAAAAAAPSLDMDQIKDMVRQVVMEQLSGEQGGALVKNILREELMSGEIGSNMSQNVMALIQAEVGKALKS